MSSDDRTKTVSVREHTRTVTRTEYTYDCVICHTKITRLVLPGNRPVLCDNPECKRKQTALKVAEYRKRNSELLKMRRNQQERLKRVEKSLGINITPEQRRKRFLPCDNKIAHDNQNVPSAFYSLKSMTAYCASCYEKEKSIKGIKGKDWYSVDKISAYIHTEMLLSKYVYE